METSDEIKPQFGDTLLEIRNLNVAYDDHQVIVDLSLDLKVGEVLGLIGPNGAGKSTLIRAISGVLETSAGEITCAGRDFLGLPPPERARILAVVPQARQLGGALTVEQTVLMGRTAYMGFLGRPSDVDLEAAWLAMSQTQVDSLAHRRNSALSGGEQQRVLLARALAQQTQILLLDEPTSHLDLNHQANFLALIVDLAQERDLGVLMAFHDLNLVSAYTHRIAMLIEGRIQAVGSPADVLTVENVQTAYNTAVHIFTHPDLDTPMVFPKRR